MFDFVVLESVTFKGHVPDGYSDFNSDPSVVAYYPRDDSTWTDAAKERIGAGARVTWVAVEFDEGGNVILPSVQSIAYARIQTLEDQAYTGVSRSPPSLRLRMAVGR